MFFLFCFFLFLCFLFIRLDARFLGIKDNTSGKMEGEKERDREEGKGNLRPSGPRRSSPSRTALWNCLLYQTLSSNHWRATRDFVETTAFVCDEFVAKFLLLSQLNSFK